MSEQDAAGTSTSSTPNASPGPKARPEATGQPASTDGGTKQAEQSSAPGSSGGSSAGSSANRNRRRRGSRGGRGRSSSGGASGGGGTGNAAGGGSSSGRGAPGAAGNDKTPDSAPDDDRMPENLPDRHRENRPSAEAADKALVRRKPQIGDTIPADKVTSPEPAAPRGGGRGRSAKQGGAAAGDKAPTDKDSAPKPNRRKRGGSGRGGGGGGGRTRGGGQRQKAAPVEALTPDAPVELDEEVLERRRGKERNGKALGRYLMAVHVKPEAAQIAVLEGRSLIEHYVSRPTDDISQIHGNVYLARVQNVLPGMEAAFVDIGTPKNAVLYRGDTRYDPEDIEQKGEPRIEQILKNRQVILCQVTKNPIAHKGARLTQEISMPGRFVVLIPNSTTYGISKRLPDTERKRLRKILDKVKPAEHGLIVRTAAEGVTAEEIQNDVLRLADQWRQVEQRAAKAQAPQLLYREPDMAVRVIREEFNKDYRKVVIDDRAIYEEVRDYVAGISPALADRVEHYDPSKEPLPLLEKFHVHEQLHKALDRKVWLPSGGSLIIEHTEALTVIDVNTGKNVGTSSLEETVYRNNLEAAEEVARQLRLRDIGGIIVIDFIDMEVRKNRDEVIKTFRAALARDKTRTQVFDISELGLVEMTRKRIGEGLLESFTAPCEVCEGRGVVIDKVLLGDDDAVAP
jgi:ribonuclease E